MKHRAAAWFSLAFLSVFFCTVVQADFGPKDQLTVYVENPPDELYYLDLLYEADPAYEIYENLSEQQMASLHGDMLARIRANIFGMKAVLTDGTPIPTFGSLTGEEEGGRMKHTFSYYGLPDTYRIILVTESGTVRVTEEYERKSMQSSIVYDYESGLCEVPPLWKQYAVQFLYTFGMTLVLEGALFFLFRFRSGRDWIVFLLVNLATQLVMTAIVGRTLILSGTVSAMLRLQLLEIGILAVESAAYAFFLRGGSYRRRVLYGVCANLVSWIAGSLSLNLLYSAIVAAA